MATLQVRSIDDQLYQALGARAAREQRSISQEVVVLIKEHLASTKRDAGAATRAFLELAGTWDDPRTEQAIAASIRGARRTRRRFTGEM